jgi:hypothetical protein
MPHQGLNELACPNQSLDVDACVDIHSLEQSHHVLTGSVAAGALGVRTSSYPTQGNVKRAHAVLPSHERIQ